MFRTNGGISFRKAAAPLVLTAAALSVFAIVPSARQLRDQSFLRFKEEHMVIEYNPAIDEGVVRLDAENEESVDRVEVRDPNGVTLFNLQAQDVRGPLGIQGLVIESLEMGADDLMRTYRAGIYSLRGRSMRVDFDRRQGTQRRALPTRRTRPAQ